MTVQGTSSRAKPAVIGCLTEGKCPFRVRIADIALPNETENSQKRESRTIGTGGGEGARSSFSKRRLVIHRKSRNFALLRREIGMVGGKRKGNKILDGKQRLHAK